MTSTTSSRSAKGTRKTADVPDTNGTPPTDPNSELTSGFTEWTMEMRDGRIKKARVQGANGRISFGRSAPRLGGGMEGDVRIYRTQSAKGYDALISGVKNIWSDKVIVEDFGVKPEVEELSKKMAEKKERREREKLTAVLDAVVKEHAATGEAPRWGDEPEETEVDADF